MQSQPPYPWVIARGRDPLLASIAQLRESAFAGSSPTPRSPSGKPPFLDRRDALDVTTHCLVFDGDEPVAAARLQTADLALATEDGTTFGFCLEADLELQGFMSAGVFAEVSRLCVLPSARRTTEAFPRLVAALVSASAALSVQHWCAEADCETDDPAEAAELYRMTARLGRLHQAVRASARPAPGDPAGERPSFPHSRPTAGIEPRAALPPMLGMYLSKLGAKAIGRPYRSARLGGFAMPIAVSVAELASGNSAYSRRLRRVNAAVADNDNIGAPRSAA